MFNPNKNDKDSCSTTERGLLSRTALHYHDAVLASPQDCGFAFMSRRPFAAAARLAPPWQKLQPEVSEVGERHRSGHEVAVSIALPCRTGTFPTQIAHRHSLQVRPQGGYDRIQIFTAGSRVEVGRAEVFANVAFQDVGHEAIDRTAHRCNLLKDCDAFDTLIQRPFKCFRLPLDATYPREELLLSLDRMRHSRSVKDRSSILGYSTLMNRSGTAQPSLAANGWEHSHVFDDGNPLAERNTLLAVVLTAAMMVVEIVGGWIYNSMALLADGWHMSSHALALGLAVAAYVAARRLAADGGLRSERGRLKY